MNGFFSLQGRLNRAKYFWRTLLIGIGVNIMAFVVAFLLGGIMGENAEPAALLVGYLLALAGAVVIAFEAVKRLHDLERPGAHYWLLLIPGYNIYLALVLLFKRGTNGPNRYGADPLAAPQGDMAVARPAA
jgi:uncharacterized membrane protein YhaH (DUF805 family)